MDLDGIYSPKDMADILGIGDSTLRKWCIALEENELFFARTENNKRLFTNQDIVILKNFRDLVKVQNMSIENAAMIVASKYKDIKRTAFQTENTEDGESSLSDGYSKIFEEMEQLKELNRQLLLRLDEQQKYIEQRLNRLDEQIERRDELLMKAIREQQETRKLLVASKEEENKKGFLGKLFKK